MLWELRHLSEQIIHWKILWIGFAIHFAWYNLNSIFMTIFCWCLNSHSFSRRFCLLLEIILTTQTTRNNLAEASHVPMMFRRSERENVNMNIPCALLLYTRVKWSLRGRGGLQGIWTSKLFYLYPFYSSSSSSWTALKRVWWKKIWTP